MKSNKLAGIEAGRGIAALLVVGVHTRDHVFKNYGVPVPFGDWFIFGHAGVDFFFVLSGFIICWVHSRDVGRPDRLGHYIERRFTRIFPFYWIVCLVTLAMLVLSTHSPLPTLPKMVSSFLLLPFGGGPFVDVAWTLQHEIIFYVLFALLIINWRIGALLMALWFAVACLDVGSGWAGAGAIVSPFNAEFVFGMGAAWWLARRTVPAPFALLILGAAIFLLAGIAENNGWVPGLSLLPHLGYTVGATLAILGLVETERQGRLAVPRFMASIGSASYAIYLTHLIAIGVVWQVMVHAHLARALPLWAQFVVLFVGAAAGGWIASVAVEQPAMKFVRNLMGRPRPVAQAAPAD